MTHVTLYLLRHGKVDGHSGDVPLANGANEAIDKAAALIEAETKSRANIAFLSTLTRRSRDTAAGIRERLSSSPKLFRLGAVVPETAIRNPDLYLAGHRVEMVSNGAAMAQQLPDGTMTGEAVENTPFFGDFFRARDRIEYWLCHDAPPGEDARAVARRVISFCKSLGDASQDPNLTIVAVSHSPVMRAVLVEYMCVQDPGEPDWVEPITVKLENRRGTVTFRNETRDLLFEKAAPAIQGTNQ